MGKDQRTRLLLGIKCNYHVELRKGGSAIKYHNVKPEIKEALKHITKGIWSVEKGESYYDNFVKSVDGTLHTVVASRVMIGDANLIVNTPTWLEVQTVEIDRYKDAVESLYQIIQRGDLTSFDMKQADEVLTNLRGE